MSCFFSSSLAFAAEKKSYRFNLRTNTLSYLNGYNAGLDFRAGFSSFGVYYTRSNGTTKLLGVTTKSDVKEIGARVDLYLSGAGLSKSFVLSFIALRSVGSSHSEKVTTEHGKYCQIESSSNGSIYGAKSLLGYNWFSTWGLNAGLSGGVTYVFPSSPRTSSMSSINCTVKQSNRHVLPVAEFFVGLGI